MKDVVAVILSGGRGKRMQTMHSKALHKVADRTILDWQLDACQLSGIENIIIVVGAFSDEIRNHLARDGHALNIYIAVQDEPLGTAHALAAAMDKVHELKARYVVVLNGDLPNLQSSTLKKLMLKRAQKQLMCLTVKLDEPAAYGRILRNADGNVERIIEFKDCTQAQTAIREVNVGVYSIPTNFLDTALPKIQNNNAAKEYYLTDIIAIANEDNLPVHAVLAEDPGEVMGVNTPEELELAEIWRHKLSL